MKLISQNCLRSVRGTALSGLTVGFALALSYSLVFALYAIVRSSLQIGSALTWREGLMGTLLANALAILAPVVVFALLLGTVAAIITSLALLLVHGLSTYFNPRHDVHRAVWIGFISAGSLTCGLILFAQQSLGIYFAALWPAGFLFWLGLPCLLFVITVTWLSWRAGEYSRGQ